MDGLLVKISITTNCYKLIRTQKTFMRNVKIVLYSNKNMMCARGLHEGLLCFDLLKERFMQILSPNFPRNGPKIK